MGLVSLPPPPHSPPVSVLFSSASYTLQKKPMASASHQAVQLGDGTLAARLADVPYLHTALAACVDVPRGVADGHGTYHLPMAECVDLPGMPGNAGAC